MGPIAFFRKPFHTIYSLASLTIFSLTLQGNIIINSLICIKSYCLFCRAKANDYMWLYYVKPWCRVGPYAVGLFTGYMLYRYQLKMKINKVRKYVLACVVPYPDWNSRGKSLTPNKSSSNFASHSSPSCLALVEWFYITPSVLCF